MASPPRALDPTNEWDRTGLGSQATRRALDPLKIHQSGGGTALDPLKLRGGGSSSPGTQPPVPEVNVGTPPTRMRM